MIISCLCLYTRIGSPCSITIYLLWSPDFGADAMRSRIARFTSLAASRSKLGGTWEKHAHVSSLNHTKSSSLVQSSRCIDACEPAHQHPKQDAGKRWPGGSAFLLALGATGAYALGETRDSRETSPVGRSAALEGLNHFLAKCSVDVRGIEVRQIAKVPNDESNTDDNDELGLVVTREGARMYGAGLLNWVGSWLTPWTWFGETQLARFPLTAVISLDTATEDPWFGGMITELVAAGVMNERSALALYLALHRWAPAFQLRPSGSTSWSMCTTPSRRGAPPALSRRLCACAHALLAYLALALRDALVNLVVGSGDDRTVTLLQQTVDSSISSGS